MRTTFVLLLVACGAPVELPEPDAGPPVVADDRINPPPRPLTWRPGPTLTVPRDHHASLIVQRGARAWLYVVGGTDGWVTLHDTIERAELVDGGLSAFEIVGHLPQLRAGHTAVELDGRLVVAGGLTQIPQGRYVMDSTVFVPLDADGALGAWTEGPRLPEAVMHHSCDVHGGAMICLGGRIVGNFTGSLAVRTSFSHGALQPYSPVTALPHPLGFHQLFIRAGRLWLAGGLRRDRGAADFIRLAQVWSAPLNGDGSLGEWSRAADLPEPLNVGAATVFDDRVLFVGGMDGMDRHVHVVRELQADGGFVELPHAPATARMHVHQVPAHGGRLYLAGGRLHDDSSTATVEVGAAW